MIKNINLWLILSILFSANISANILNKDIEYMVAKSAIKNEELGLYIKETKTNRVVSAINIDKLFTPASVIKVYSAYALLLELGYNYRWMTNFYIKGRFINGIVYGDLIVKGYGDPTLKSSDIPKIVNSLKAKGLKKINGDIIIDRSYFSVKSKDSSHFDKNIYSPYNAMPDAMMFNQHTSNFKLYPKNGRYVVEKLISGDSYKVSNQIKTVGGSCAGKRANPSISVSYASATPTLVLKGKLSNRCKKRYYKYIITKPYKEFYNALKNEFHKQGIKYNGRMRLSRVPSGAKKIFVHYSDRLENIIATTAKKSNNLFARHLLLTLGAKIYGAPSTLAKGRKAVERVLNRYHLLNYSKTCIDNGCGLSRSSKITSRSMAKVLDHAYKSYGDRWLNILSIAGKDGTIKRRFAQSVVKNRAWMKTGTLDRVKNIVGYVKAKTGTLYTVVILVNSKYSRWAGSALQNKIIKWLVDYKGVEDGNNIFFTPKEQREHKPLWDISDLIKEPKVFRYDEGDL